MTDTDFTELFKNGLRVIPDQLASRFETLLNHYLRLDPETSKRMSALTDNIIAIDMLLGPFEQSTPQITLYFVPGNQRCQVTTTYPGAPDVVIRGTPLSLMGQLYQASRGGAVNDLEVTGDLSLGKAFQEVLRDVHIDWEEQLAQRVGDVPAHQMGNAARQLRAWTQQSLQSLFQNTGEYLHYEAYDLPPPGALNEFMDAVDEIYSDTERLEARIQRLQRAAMTTLSKTKKPTHS